MRQAFKTTIALLCCSITAGAPLSSLAAGIPSPPFGLTIEAPQVTPPPTPTPDPIPITPPGNDGLLSGMTPANYRIPSGWSLVKAQDFEGTKPSNENWGSWDGEVTTNRPHSGSKSIEGTYSHGQADTAWILSASAIGSYSEVYLSFFEYIESQALFNDEFFLAQFYRTDPFQEVILDWYWARQTPSGPLSYNGAAATLYAVPQGIRTARYADKTTYVPKGTWVQWEIHFRPNTTTGGVANSDGFIRVYKDGTRFTSAENVNLNGTAVMSGSTNIKAGGVYTKAVWMTDYPSCSACGANPGDGTDYCTNPNNWASQLFSSPICKPVDPPLPSFKRHFDDIIVMKK